MVFYSWAILWASHQGHYQTIALYKENVAPSGSSKWFRKISIDSFKTASVTCRYWHVWAPNTNTHNGYICLCPILVPKTDAYGRPFTDGTTKISSITTSSKPNQNSPYRKTDSSKTYVYIAVGAVTFLMVTAAVLLVWVMKRKHQRRVENAEICET